MAAAMVAGGREPRKHHLVPRFYLERWSEGGMIRSTDIDAKYTFTSPPEKAAKRTDFYRVEEGTFKWGTAIDFEVFLSVLEGKVAGITRRLLDDSLQPSELDVESEGELLWYAALQMTRGVNFRRGLQWNQLQTHVIKYEWGGDASLSRRLERSGLEATAERVATMRSQLTDMQHDPQKLPMLTALKVKHSASMASSLIPYLATRKLVVYRTPARLVTCDEPVVALDTYLGADTGSFGAANAPIIVLPLAPTAVLAMFRHDVPVLLDASEELTVAEVLDLNQAILGNAFRYAFERPSMTLTSKLHVPPLPPAGERRVVSKGGDGKELHELIVGRRWRNEPGAPIRPVHRWWR
ncbi:DUF4238 domain-containing protein [Cryobacterium sp. Y50]|uniref:DUF4238 domain-containing protein n=1 Tax=Cryobacterium sp. Y50 TaxID=2048286 RepID=UPI001304A21B|nr:DUF4238 domain-containing protein [Cryobacterium sp. Y50]